MGRWVRVLLGPLPATVLLLPLLFAGGLGAGIALVAALVEPGHSAAERWATVTSTGAILGWIAAAAAGVLALWAMALAEPPAALRQAPARWWLAAGLLLGLVAASRWLGTMTTAGHGYGTQTWMVWLVLLVGPLALGSYGARPVPRPLRRSGDRRPGTNAESVGRRRVRADGRLVATWGVLRLWATGC